MRRRGGTAGFVLPAAALATLLLVDVLRVWLPSVLFVVGEAGDTPATVLGAFALGCLGTGVLGAVVVARVGSRAPWLAGALMLATTRLVLPLTDGGAPQAAVATAGVVAGVLAMVALAAGAWSGHAARVGVLAGVAASVAQHAALGTYDLVWRDGPGPFAAGAVLAVALAVAAVRVAAESGWDDRSPEAGPAWPWLVLAPTLLLVGIVTGVPSRASMAFGWPDAGVAAALTLAHGLAVAVTAAGPRLAPAVTGTAGAATTMIATAIALRPTEALAVVAQLALPIGVGLVVAALGTVRTSAEPRRRGAVTAATILLFGAGAFGYYASYDLVVPVPNRAILLAAAVGLAVLGLAAGYAGERRPGPLRRALRPAAAVAASTLALAGIVTLATPGTTTVTPHPGSPGVPVRLALYNIHMGFDVEGRFAVDDQAAVLAELAPDIVVLNEVDRGWLLTGGHDTLRLLADRLDLPFVFAPAADEVWGNALLSRYPVTELTRERLPSGGAPMARSKLAAIVEIAEGHHLGLVGTHLSHVDVQGGTRVPQARALAAAVARLHLERGAPTVLLGDLNAEPGDPELAPFEDLLTSALPPDAATWPSWSPVSHIDHVLVSDDVRVVEVTIPASQASDHLPVGVTIEPLDP